MYLYKIFNMSGIPTKASVWVLSVYNFTLVLKVSILDFQVVKLFMINSGWEFLNIFIAYNYLCWLDAELSSGYKTIIAIFSDCFYWCSYCWSLGGYFQRIFYQLNS